MTPAPPEPEPVRPATSSADDNSAESTPAGSSPAGSSPATPGFGKRMLFALLGLVLAVAAVEIFSFLALVALEGGFDWPDELHQQRLAVLGEGTADEIEERLEEVRNPEGAQVFTWRSRQVIHPFVGYVNEAHSLPFYRPEQFDPISQGLGFPFNREPIFRAPADDSLVVGIFGGSFAEQTARAAGSVLAEALEASGRFAGREVVVLGFATGGYKQPQQLMTLGYLVSLGVHLDVVINLDGFNEINLPVTENLQQGVHPIFPRGWKLRVAGLDPTLRERMGELAWLGRLRRGLALFVENRTLSGSPTLNLVWRQLDRRLAATIGDREARLVADDAGADDARAENPDEPGRGSQTRRESNSVGVAFQPGKQPARGDEPRNRDDFQAEGPQMPEYQSWEQVYDELTATWARSSRAMHGLSQSQGAEYFHFLQPNLYYPGSKPPSAEEAAMAYYEGHPWRRGIRLGYPKMLAAGEDLARDGIRFQDLLFVFRDDERTLYADPCCHANVEGYSIVARRMAEVIAEIGEEPGAR